MTYQLLQELKVKYAEKYALFVKDLGNNADYGFSQWAKYNTPEGQQALRSFVKEMYGA